MKYSSGDIWGICSMTRAYLLDCFHTQEESHSGQTPMCTALWQQKRAQHCSCETKQCCDSSGSDSAKIMMCTLKGSFTVMTTDSAVTVMTTDSAVTVLSVATTLTVMGTSVSH